MPKQSVLISSPQQRLDLKALMLAGDLKKGSDNPEAVKVLQLQLHALGYLSKNALTSKFDDQTVQAVKLFQKYAGIESTGILDALTLQKMARPRYDDLPDIPSPQDEDNRAASEAFVDSARYVTTGVKWKTNELTFSFQNFTADVTQQQVQRVLRDAFAEWSDGTILQFYEKPDAANINIRIRFGNIDAPSGILARTTWWYTGNEITKTEIVFDEFETWSAVNQTVGGQPIELFVVSVHEIGHAIGLNHSADTGAIMYAYYNPGLDDLTQDDLNGIQSIYGGDSNKNILVETSVYAPSGALLNNRLFTGWAGTDSAHRLNIIQSEEEGVYFSKVTLGDTSPVGISLAVFKNRLYIAWTGTGNRKLNVMSSLDGIHWGNKITLLETSPHRPVLAEHKGVLVLGWTGTDSSHRLNVLFSNDGINWGAKKTLTDTSIDAPSLASFNERLFISWTGTNSSHNLNVMSTGNFGASWQNKRILGDTGIAGPSLRLFKKRLLLSWSGRDNNRSINTLESTDGLTWVNKRTYRDSSDYTPELTEAYGTMAFIWTGRDSRHHLNIMTL
jgi:peptidoglycan hydrolase-like protein with peptidoglycan-binding domain